MFNYKLQSHVFQKDFFFNKSKNEHKNNRGNNSIRSQKDCNAFSFVLKCAKMTK